MTNSRLAKLQAMDRAYPALPPVPTPVKLAHGRRMSRLLQGAWRQTPPPVETTAAELEPLVKHFVDAGLAGLIWWRIRTSPVARTPTGAHLREHYVAQSIRSTRSVHSVYRYVSTLRRHDIESIVFKGWALFPHYAEPGLRPPGDVDLVVEPHEGDRAFEVLSELGATKVDVDVHHGLNDPAHAAYIPDSTWHTLLGRSRTARIGELDVRVLSPEDAFQVVCIHCIRHFAARPLWLSDVAALIETAPPDFDWTRALSHPPYSSWIIVTMLLAHRLLGANLQGTPIANRSDSLPHWLEQDVLSRWIDPLPFTKRIHPSLFRLWREPSQWGDAVRVRLPNRLVATMEYYGSLDEPFLARYQMRALWRNMTGFAKRKASGENKIE